IAVVVAPLSLYLTIRPISTLDMLEVQSRAVREGELFSTFRLEKFHPNQPTTFKPYIYVSDVGPFAKIQGLIQYLLANKDSNVPSPSKVITDPHLSPLNKAIAAIPETPVLRINWDIIILGFGSLIVAIAGVLVLRKPSESLSSMAAICCPIVAYVK